MKERKKVEKMESKSKRGEEMAKAEQERGEVAESVERSEVNKEMTVKKIATASALMPFAFSSEKYKVKLLLLLFCCFLLLATCTL